MLQAKFFPKKSWSVEKLKECVFKILQKILGIENTIDFTLIEMLFTIIKVLVNNVDGYYHLHLKDIAFESTPKSKSRPQTEMRGLLFL